MGIKQFADEIARFLASKDPEVLCITGKWGVGKTFAWNRYLKEAQSRNKVALPRYAYVSLFGQNSLDDVRYALFENTIASNLVGKKADLATLQSSVTSILGKWRGLLQFGKYLPRVGDFAAGIGKLGFITVRDQIICIDDLERAGTGLDTKDILGLVSFLKEQRDCKVVLVLNDEAFTGQAEADFRIQLEKVADTVLRFEPTPSEAAEIGVDKSTSFHKWLSANCIALGIVNIRVIKRIERFARRLEEELKTFDPRILQQAIHSATLFIYAKYQPDDAPSLEFIQKFNPYEGLIGKKEKEETNHTTWRALLSQYSFTNVDEFDRVILQGVQQGRFNTIVLNAAAKKQEHQLKLQDKDRSFSQAWDAYHDSFDDNAEAVLDGMEDAIRKYAPAITPMNLSGTIGFLKEMGRGKNAKELIQQYVKARTEGHEFWDLSNYPFRGDIKDPDVVDAFKQQFEASSKKPEPGSILDRIGTQKGWNPEDVAFLASLSADDFYTLFKTRRGLDLRRIVYGALMFRDIGNADEKMKLVTKNAQDALRKIAAESPMNARRVKQYIADA